MRSCVTVTNHPIPPLILCHRVTPKDDKVTTVYTPWTTPSDTIAKNSCTHAHIRLCMRKVKDVSLLCHKVAFKPRSIVEGQGCFV